MVFTFHSLLVTDYTSHRYPYESVKRVHGRRGQWSNDKTMFSNVEVYLLQYPNTNPVSDVLLHFILVSFCQLTDLNQLIPRENYIAGKVGGDVH